jgi:hypothetical protein
MFFAIVDRFPVALQTHHTLDPFATVREREGGSISSADSAFSDR